MLFILNILIYVYLYIMWFFIINIKLLVNMGKMEVGDDEKMVLIFVWGWEVGELIVCFLIWRGK